MKILKLNEPDEPPKVSLILVDWSVRESFHIIDYLKKQSVPRESFEIIIVEFYGRESEALEPYKDEVDSWILLEAPTDCYYHKHVMYNAGIIAAQGEIVMIGDSDAMVRDSFIKSIITAFKDDPAIVLHLDQYRNNRRDLYPFNNPSFEDILTEGCVNDDGGVTSGIADKLDPLHTRNYGACMSARRSDLIAVGGADEHIDFVGHICGPYDLTFRLINLGRREIWHDREFTYHSWHPGASGVDNYQGPHDGRQMSSTSLAALSSGRIKPLLENTAIRLLRTGAETDRETLLNQLVDPADYESWRESSIVRTAQHPDWKARRLRTLPTRYRGQLLSETDNGEIVIRDIASGAETVCHSDIDTALRQIDKEISLRIRMAQWLGRISLICGRLWEKLIRETITNRSGAS